jgi:predicted TIM-barrel enzyme
MVAAIPGRAAVITVGSAEEARRAVASGVDVIVAQGWEAGGHVRGTVAMLPLVAAVVDAVATVPGPTAQDDLCGPQHLDAEHWLGRYSAGADQKSAFKSRDHAG